MDSAEAAVVQAGKECSWCKAVNANTARFCAECGKGLASSKGTGMNFAKVIAVVIGLMIMGGLLVGGCAYNGYKKAIRLDEEVNAAWAQVENVLQRRFDLIPNLVETVKGVAEQEKDLFTGVAKARAGYQNAKTVGEKAKAAGILEAALSRQISVVVERYPEMKSNESFLNLQVSLEGTENRLSVERKRYNDSVKNLNLFARGPLGRIWASFAGVKQAEYFEIDDAARQTPKVDFSGDTD